MNETTLYVADPASVRVVGASPPSWMCEALLVEKGVPHARVSLSFEKGEHRSPEMLARNPRGTIPVLVDRGAVVHEAFAILCYLEHAFSGHLPEGRADRALALTRLFEAEALKAAGMRALAYLMRRAPEERDPVELAAQGAELRSELARWDACLAETPFVAGGAPTLADFALHAYVATLAQLGLSLEATPRLAEHEARMALRPSFTATRPSGWGAPAERSPWGRS